MYHIEKNSIFANKKTEKQNAEIYADLIVCEIRKRGYNDAEIQFIITNLAEMKGVKLVQLEQSRNALSVFFPKDLQLSDEGIRQWLQKRVIPKSRAFVHEILKSLGLSSNDLKGIIDICKGLSLNDSYWVVPIDFKGTFAEYNLYENKFDNVLSLIAYTGVASASTNFTYSPELTTNGNLPKGWRILSDGIECSSISLRYVERYAGFLL